MAACERSMQRKIAASVEADHDVKFLAKVLEPEWSDVCLAQSLLALVGAPPPPKPTLPPTMQRNRSSKVARDKTALDDNDDNDDEDVDEDDGLDDFIDYDTIDENAPPELLDHLQS